MPSSGTQTPAVVVVANRLPVRHGDGGWELSPGGLVTALRPVMANHSGTGSAGTAAQRGYPRAADLDVRLLPIGLSAPPAP
jgi:trehalose 6-phosphate synthase